MRDEELRERIVSDLKVMAGKPCIRGTRIPARLIVNLLAHGATFDEIFEEYPRLTRDDILACLLHAADILDRTPAKGVFDGDERLAVAERVERERLDG